MRKKKSYMNQSNIISEGLFSAIGNAISRFGKVGAERKLAKLKKSLGKDKAKFDKLNKKYQKMTQEFDKEFEKLTGVKAERGDTIEDLIDYAEDEAKRRGYI